MTIEQRSAPGAEATPRGSDAPSGRRLGFVAGLVAIGCCVYPVVLFALGLATATQAIALGTTLFGEWGWAFKLGGAAVGIGGIVYQLRKRGECSVRGARKNWAFLARVVFIGVAVYFVLYGLTTVLANWGE